MKRLIRATNTLTNVESVEEAILRSNDLYFRDRGDGYLSLVSEGTHTVMGTVLADDYNMFLDELAESNMNSIQIGEEIVHKLNYIISGYSPR